MIYFPDHIRKLTFFLQMVIKVLFENNCCALNNTLWCYILFVQSTKYRKIVLCRFLLAIPLNDSPPHTLLKASWYHDSNTKFLQNPHTYLMSLCEILFSIGLILILEKYYHLNCIVDTIKQNTLYSEHWEFSAYKIFDEKN